MKILKISTVSAFTTWERSFTLLIIAGRRKRLFDKIAQIRPLTPRKIQRTIVTTELVTERKMANVGIALHRAAMELQQIQIHLEIGRNGVSTSSKARNPVPSDPYSAAARYGKADMKGRRSRHLA